MVRPKHAAILHAQVEVTTLGYQTVVEQAEKFEGIPKQISAWKARLFERNTEERSTEPFGAAQAGDSLHLR